MKIKGNNYALSGYLTKRLQRRRHHSQNENRKARYGQYDALLRWAKRRTDCGPISRLSEFLGRTSRGSSRALPSAPEASMDEAQKKGAPAMLGSPAAAKRVALP